MFARLRSHLHDATAAAAAVIMLSAAVALLLLTTATPAGVAGTTTTNGPPARVFIAVGSAPKQTALRTVLRRTWLADCAADTYCDYRFFTDAPKREALAECADDFCEEDMVLTDMSLKGYTNFGSRGHLQLNYSLTHFDFDHYLRVDDDGMLCYQHFRATLALLPRTRLVWGRYMCQQHLARMDENFLLLSRDLALMFNEGWDGAPAINPVSKSPEAPFTKLPWNGHRTMAINIGLVLALLDATIVGDSARRFRWNEPILESTPSGLGPAMKKQRCVEPSRFDHGHFREVVSDLTVQCPDLCQRYVWLHHVSAETINRTHSNLDQERLVPEHVELPQYQRDPSGCSWGQKIPLYHPKQYGGCTYYCPRVFGFNTSNASDVQRVRDYAARHWASLEGGEQRQQHQQHQQPPPHHAGRRSPAEGQ